MKSTILDRITTGLMFALIAAIGVFALVLPLYLGATGAI